MIFANEQVEAVYDAVLNFTNNNADTKAGECTPPRMLDKHFRAHASSSAVIGTYNVLGTPGSLEPLGLNITGLDRFMILFNVYDGPDGAAAFAQFTAIPHLADTRMKQSYTSIAEMVDIGTLSSGTVSYRAGSHHSQGEEASATLKTAVQNFQDFATQHKGTYDILSFDVQPVPAPLVEASRARGGNAQDSVDGPYVRERKGWRGFAGALISLLQYWINYLFSYLPGTPGIDDALAALKTSVEKTPNDPDLPIFVRRHALSATHKHTHPFLSHSSTTPTPIKPSCPRIERTRRSRRPRQSMIPKSASIDHHRRTRAHVVLTVTSRPIWEVRALRRRVSIAVLLWSRCCIVVEKRLCPCCKRRCVCPTPVRASPLHRVLVSVRFVVHRTEWHPICALFAFHTVQRCRLT